jgi:hypothetical protein
VADWSLKFGRAHPTFVCGFCDGGYEEKDGAKMYVPDDDPGTTPYGPQSVISVTGQREDRSGRAPPDATRHTANRGPFVPRFGYSDAEGGPRHNLGNLSRPVSGGGTWLRGPAEGSVTLALPLGKQIMTFRELDKRLRGKVGIADLLNPRRGLAYRWRRLMRG